MNWLGITKGHVVPPVRKEPEIITIPMADQACFESFLKLRYKKKLYPCHWDSGLYEIALAHSQYQLSKGKVSHDGFAERLKGFPTAAENAALTFGESPYDGWYRSPGHYKNMIGPLYSRVAIAEAHNVKNEYYWTMLLARVD